MLWADFVFRVSAIIAIKGYDTERMLSQTGDFACLGLRDMALTQQCHARWHSLSNAMSDGTHTAMPCQMVKLVH